MLVISPELALAFESGTLARWKTEIAALLARRFPAEAAKFPGGQLENWVREAMDGVRRMGAVSRRDIETYVVSLFLVTEVEQDDRAAEDFVVIMLGDGAFPAKMAFLRKAFA